MGEKRALRTLIEWEAAVVLGIVVEPPASSVGTPRSGIGCPNLLDRNGHVCGSHLFDLEGTYFKNGELRRDVVCGTCCWKGSRRVAKGRKTNGYINGK